MRARSQLEVIVNPASANGRTARHWPSIRGRLEGRGFSVCPHFTAGRGDATRLARELAVQGVPEIVVVGGDGTVNEVVNGLVGQDRPASDTVLSLIPAGTGRDIARSLGVKDQRAALEFVGSGPVYSVDAGLIAFQTPDGPAARAFVGIADVGLGAQTAARIEHSSKALGGFISYLNGAVRTIATFKGSEVRVLADDELFFAGPAAIVVLANGRYLGGGMDIAPMASMSDGHFEVFVLRDVPRRTLLTSLLPRVYVGKHVGLPSVSHIRARQVRVESPRTLPMQADGEQPGSTDIDGQVLPGALRFRASSQASTLQPATI